MKTKLLILALTATVMFGFSNKPVYPDYVPEKTIQKFENEFLKKMTNINLINHIAENFISLFDNVNTIHAQYSEENGYYYLVFGEKENTSKIELLQIEKEDYLNERYTYIDFSNIKNNGSEGYCYKGIGSSFPPGCPTAEQCVNSFTGFCATIICGVWNGRECIQQ